ncbi:hypothetical protein [Streptomyces sp. NPDC059970]
MMTARVRVVEEAHWDGLPTGKGRRTTTGEPCLRMSESAPVCEAVRAAG